MYASVGIATPNFETKFKDMAVCGECMGYQNSKNLLSMSFKGSWLAVKGFHNSDNRSDLNTSVVPLDSRNNCTDNKILASRFVGLAIVMIYTAFGSSGDMGLVVSSQLVLFVLTVF